jgi:endonuclease VIII
MPEGHSVVRWARALGALVGEPLLGVTLPRRWADRVEALVGQHLAGVDTHGKHLLIRLSGSATIHCHAMQYGSWQIEAIPPEQAMEYRKEARYVRLRLRTAAHEAVFFHGPVVEVLTPEELAAHEKLNALGPDVMKPDFDRDEAARRVAACGLREIGDTVLDQRVMAGLGNIFKSEGLFLAGIHPQRPAATIARSELEALWDEIIPVMWRGVEAYGPTKTTPPELQAQGQWHWTYGRSRRPCLRCQTPVRMIRQGELQRSTFFCPTCQPEVQSMAAAA